MTTLSDQVDLLRTWFPLAEFDQERPDEPAGEKKLRGYLYVALARIEELEIALNKKHVEPAPEPVSSFLEENNAPAIIDGEKDLPEPGRPILLFRGRGWRQVREPSPFNKYRTAPVSSEDTTP